MFTWGCQLARYHNLHTALIYTYIYIYLYIYTLYSPCGAVAQRGARPLILEVSRPHTIWHTHTHTHCMTPLDERSARRRDLYLTTQTSMPPARLEPAIPASQLPHTHALDRAAIRIGAKICTSVKPLFCGNFLLLLDSGRECVPG